MVCNWLPEPPRDMDDRMPMPSQVVAVESEESEDEGQGNAPPGYELLPQGPALELSSDEENQSDTEDGGEGNTSSNQPIDTPSTSQGLENQSDTEDGGEGNTSSNQPIDTPSTSQGLVRRRSEVEEVARLYTSALRPELMVDSDQVRAAMTGFTLPPSAFPAWAANVPESQWAATLAQQIQRLQANRPNT